MAAIICNEPLARALISGHAGRISLSNRHAFLRECASAEMRLRAAEQSTEGHADAQRAVPGDLPQVCRSDVWF